MMTPIMTLAIRTIASTANKTPMTIPAMVSSSEGKF